jgi:hypothetical protein
MALDVFRATLGSIVAVSSKTERIHGITSLNTVSCQGFNRCVKMESLALR